MKEKNTGETMIHIKKKLYYFLIIMILSATTITSTSKETPKLAIVIVVDQLAQHLLEKTKPYLKSGIKWFLNHGTSYTHAYHPHAVPFTAVSHATMNTGTFANKHSIINNWWFDKQGNKITSDSDTTGTALVLKPNGTYNYGKSSHHCMVEGLSEIFAQQPTHNVVALSLKSHAAVMAANKKGKAFWYDKKAHRFTSSKAYVSTLPDWITQLNTTNKLLKKDTFHWKSFHSKSNPAYSCADNNYTFAGRKKGLIGKTIDKHQQFMSF